MFVVLMQNTVHLCSSIYVCGTKHSPFMFVVLMQTAATASSPTRAPPSRFSLSTPYTPHTTPYTLHPTPYTLHPTPYTLHPTPYTLSPRYTPGVGRAVRENRRRLRAPGRGKLPLVGRYNYPKPQTPNSSSLLLSNLELSDTQSL